MLKDIFQQGYHADQVMFRAFKRFEVSRDDRKFLSTTVYDIIRHWRLILHINNENGSLDEVNLHRIIGIYCKLKHEKLPPGKAFDKVRGENIEGKAKQALLSPEIKSLLPQWLYERGIKEIGESFHEMMEALNEPAPVFIRTNTLKISVDELIEALYHEGLNIQPTSQPEAIHVLDAGKLFKSKAYYDGWFEVQDIHSQLISRMIHPQSGQRIIDGCAGAGGKSLHLAALMKNKGKIIALDTQQKKLDELSRRAKKAGADIIETRPIESKKSLKRLEQTADIVLIDAPCSGTGVLRRNPDIRWFLDEEEIEKLIHIQAELLQDYAMCVKPGGKLIYVTCSILPSENEKQTKDFIAAHPEFTITQEKRLNCESNGGDGFYFCEMTKK